MGVDQILRKSRIGSINTNVPKVDRKKKPFIERQRKATPMPVSVKNTDVRNTPVINSSEFVPNPNWLT